MQLVISLFLLILFLFSICLKLPLFFAWLALSFFIHQDSSHLYLFRAAFLPLPDHVIYSPVILQNTDCTPLARVVMWLITQ